MIRLIALCVSLMLFAGTATVSIEIINNTQQPLTVTLKQLPEYPRTLEKMPLRRTLDIQPAETQQLIIARSNRWILWQAHTNSGELAAEGRLEVGTAGKTHRQLIINQPTSDQ